MSINLSDKDIVYGFLCENLGVKYQSKQISRTLAMRGIDMGSRRIGQALRRLKDEGLVQYSLISPKAHKYRWWTE